MLNKGKKDWKMVRLGEIIHISKGKKQTEVQDTSAKRYIQIEDLNGSSSLKFTDESGVDVNKNDVIIAWDGANAGKVGTNLSGIIGSTLARLRPLHNNIHGEFLFRYLQSRENEIKSKRTGATIPHINGAELKNLQIPLPPLAIQKQIASILDKADALRKKDRQLLDYYDQLLQSIFHSMFGDPVKNEKGWEKKKLKEFIASLEAGVSVNSTDEIPALNAKCVLKTSCVYSGFFEPKESKVILDKDLKRAKLNPIKDSIIISRMNTAELVGKSAYIPKTFKNLYLPDRLWQTTKTRLSHSVLWLSYSLKSSSFTNAISKIASGTSGSMKNISKSSFLNIEITYPPITLQNQFAAIAQNIQQQKEKVKDQMEASEQLFEALLQQAFR